MKSKSILRQISIVNFYIMFNDLHLPTKSITINWKDIKIKSFIAIFDTPWLDIITYYSNNIVLCSTKYNLLIRMLELGYLVISMIFKHTKPIYTFYCLDVQNKHWSTLQKQNVRCCKRCLLSRCIGESNTWCRVDSFINPVLLFMTKQRSYIIYLENQDGPNGYNTM